MCREGLWWNKFAVLAKRSCCCRESHPALHLTSVPLSLRGTDICQVFFTGLNKRKPGLVDQDQATKSATSGKKYFTGKWSPEQPRMYITKYPFRASPCCADAMHWNRALVSQGACWKEHCAGWSQSSFLKVGPLSQSVRHHKADFQSCWSQGDN